MADKKISQLNNATTPLAGTEVLPIVQGGSTVKVSVNNLTAGKAVSASTLSLSGGNLNLLSPASTNADFTHETTSAGTAARTRYLRASVVKFLAGLGAYTGGDTYEIATGTGVLTSIDGTGNVTFNTGNLVVGTSGKGIVDTNGNESMLFTATASAVNELTVANAATGNAPSISATGSDTNIPVNLIAKGNGNVRAYGGFRFTSEAGDSNGRLVNKLTSGVTTSAVDISPIGNTWGTLCIVNGIDPGGAFFTDLVFTAATAGPTVLSAKTISGSPAARTYTMSGSDILRIAMASGTYNIHCTVLSGIN